MHRTQIYLEEDMYDELTARARREGTTLAGLIRHLLRRALGGLADSEPDPLDAVIGLGAGDGAAVAENHADYLYGSSPSAEGPASDDRPDERPEDGPGAERRER